MKKKQKLKERICALVLALAMVLTWVLPDAGMTVQAAGGTEVEYTVSVTDEDGALADVSVSAQTGDTAAVTAKTGQNGKATLTLTKDAEYTVTLAKEGYETHTANVTPTEQNTQMNQKLRFKPFTITASDSTIAGQNVTLQIANPVAGVSYQWTANGASAAPTSGTGTSFNITCAAAGTVNVTAAAKGQTASKSIIVNKKTINTSDISISLDPDQGAVNKISVTVAGFPADAEGQVTLQYSYQGSTYTKTASKTKDITSVVIVLNAEQDVFFGKLNCTVSYANDALYNDFSGVNKDAVYRKTHELTSEQKIELDTDNDGKKEEVYGQEITYGECIDKTVELKAEDVKDRVVTYSFDENDTESQNIVTISEDGKISLKEDGHSGTAKVIVKAAETDDYAAAQMEYYIVAKPKAITVDVSKNLTVKDASKVYDGSADITVGAVVDGTLLVNGDDGTNAEKDVLEIEGVKGTLWNTTEDDADPSTVSNEVKITADSFKEAELSSKWYEITYKGENVFEGKTTVTRRTLYFGTSDIADCNYELDMFNEIQSAQAKVVTLNKDADVKDNVDYFSSEFAVVADQTKPEIEITNLSTPRNGIFKGDVKLHIEVTDPENNKTYSGLEEVWYDVKASGNVVKEVRYPSLVDNSANPVKGNQSWSGDITIPAAEYNSNDVKVQVHARDFSGNVYDSEIVPLKIDITHPTIAVTYDLNTPLNERYYKDVRTATVVVIERNFDESAVRFNITNTDGTQPAISGWTHSANAGVSDDATHTCQVTFAADGDYTFTLETTDLAGNASSYNRVDDFTIDRTVPTIQVSYDNNSAATPGYFNANRTATVTVNEHNFNAAEVNAQITAALQGSGVAAPGLGGWSTNGDVHTASVTFSADADYTFDVDYTDLAGNAAADYTQDKFTVDKTDPEVEFFDIEDKSANNGTVAPGVKYSDVNYMESGVDITIKGAKHDKTELSGNRTNIANGESIKMEDFKHDEETDDVYTMTAVIKDKAGNETEKEVMFSVNRFGSNYIFSETTEKFLDDVYANKPKDLVVTEVNVDSLVFNGISYGLDGTKKELKAGSDYTVKQSGGEGSWKEYTYTIKKENFEKEGRYSVTIDSEDKATNKMNNKVKECNIDFVIDKTPPTVVITGIEESSYRADEREMTINLSDNTAVKCVDVIIDGKSVATYAQKEIEKAGGKISYMIEGASEPQKIEAAALDMAGNETTSEMHKVLVTSSVWIQYINNTPLLIGSILGIVLVAGGLIWFFVIRKKKEESK